ncbi:hypothetical protein ACWF9G_28435 [Nocardia sp. NPDC055029]
MTNVFTVSYQQNPHVVGHVTGSFDLGDPVELTRAETVVAHGVVESIGFHRSPAGEFSFTFSNKISVHVQAGDAIRAMDTTDYLVATHGGLRLLESARDAREGKFVAQSSAGGHFDE